MLDLRFLLGSSFSITALAFFSLCLCSAFSVASVSQSCNDFHNSNYKYSSEMSLLGPSVSFNFLLSGWDPTCSPEMSAPLSPLFTLMVIASASQQELVMPSCFICLIWDAKINPVGINSSKMQIKQLYIS